MGGYHITNIEKQEYGSMEKIREEFEELLDADLQGCRVMQLVELSDIVGAVEGVLESRFPGFTIHDLLIMSNITKRAFRTGGRS